MWLNVVKMSLVFIKEHFLFTCSDVIAVGCIIYPQCTLHSITVRWTYSQTDDIIMSIALHTAVQVVLVVAVVERRTHDRKVAGSTHGRGAIK